MEKEAHRGKYFYCIIESMKPENFGEIGIDGSDVYTINYKDIGAVVSDASNSSYEVLRQGVIHQKVVETIMKKYTIIPMSFGQVPKTKDDVKGFLSENCTEIKKMFEKLNGKIELGVKVSWKMDKILKELIESSDRIRILDKQIKAKTPEKAYPLKIELGKRVTDALNEKGRKIVNDIYGSLSHLAAESKENKTLVENMILNAAFLVEKAKEKEFDEKMNEVEKKYGDKVTLKYVLSPPYNFVSLGEK
ncbi:MAG: GvpL/GvpF family gas vesicle protein [Thermoplasmata archaeon]